MIKPSDFGGLFAKRVIVTGANGAGKTWLAVRLGLPVIHNDGLALTTGWRHRPSDHVKAARDQAAADPSCVIEGGPSVLSGQAIARAQVIVWLDLPRHLRVARISWRSLRYAGRTRPEHPPGNRDWPGLRQAKFIKQAWVRSVAFQHAVAGGVDRAQCPVIRLRNTADTHALLASIP